MALTTTQGFCSCCGQARMVTVEMLGVEETAEEANRRATEQCSCPEGVGLRGQIIAHRKIHAICGDVAKRAGFDPIGPHTEECLCTIADAVLDGRFTKATIETMDSTVTLRDKASGLQVIRRSTLEIGDGTDG